MYLLNQRFGHEIYLRSGKVLGTPILPFRYFFSEVNLPYNLKITTFPAREDGRMIQMSGVCVTLCLCTIRTSSNFNSRHPYAIKAKSWIHREYGY